MKGNAAAKMAREWHRHAPAFEGRRAVRLSEVAKSRDNNFDVLRLFAAGLVLVGHSFPLTGRADPFAPHTVATMGVQIFFVISGFLVTASWLSDPSLVRFATKRALRILPGLTCAVVVTALVVGTAFATSSVTGYLGNRAVWGYILLGVCLVPHWVLPTVFATNPIAGANGALWTLPVEVRAYGLVALIGFAGLLRGRAVAPLVVALIAMNAVVHLGASTRLLSMFVAGSGLYLFRERIVLRADVAALLLVVWLASYTTRLSTAVGMIAIPYLVAYAAYCTPRALRRLTAKGDVSYGVYVYAFPIQQALVATLGPVSPGVLVVIAAPLVWLAGFASWRLVERPMLRRKRRGSPLVRRDRSKKDALGDLDAAAAL